MIETVTKHTFHRTYTIKVRRKISPEVRKAIIESDVKAASLAVEYGLNVNSIYRIRREARKP